jgi:2-polyprenyl-6-methoxyphenol hydroxylase-like FAD-dependent oxidoreductase
VHASGGHVRILERRIGSRRQSPALIVQPRTLEVLDPLGLAAALIRRGSSAATVQLHSGSRTVSLALPTPAMGDTAYQYLLMIPQWEVEAVLEEHLRKHGVLVEYGTELLSFTQQDRFVECVKGTPDSSCERVSARYLVGCDGADSVVRRLAGIPSHVGIPGDRSPR